LLRQDGGARRKASAERYLTLDEVLEITVRDLAQYELAADS